MYSAAKFVEHVAPIILVSCDGRINGERERITINKIFQAFPDGWQPEGSMGIVFTIVKVVVALT